MVQTQLHPGGGSHTPPQHSAIWASGRIPLSLRVYEEPVSETRHGVEPVWLLKPVRKVTMALLDEKSPLTVSLMVALFFKVFLN